MAVVTMRQLLESGVHFGHQTRRWNPKMKRFIFTERNGIYIIDLQQSLSYIDRSFEFVRETVARGGQILFVGTKKQAQAAIAEQSTRVGMPYVNQRWLGGMLTNFQTVNKRLQRLKELEVVDFDDVAGSDRTKKELLGMRREMNKLERSLGGIRDMGRVPAAVWIIDTNKEHLAVDEAKKLGIPVVAVLDTNCDPDDVDYPIPGNDDAIRSVGLLTRVIADAVAEGLMARSGVRTGEEPAGSEVGADEPMAEWERELLGGAAAEAAAAATTAPAAAAAEAATTDDSVVSTADAPGDRPAASETAEAVAAEALGVTVADALGQPPEAGSDASTAVPAGAPGEAGADEPTEAGVAADTEAAADDTEAAADTVAAVEADVDSDAAVGEATAEADSSATV